MTARHEMVELVLHAHIETEHAWFVSETGDKDDAVWLPKSQIDDDDMELGRACDVLVPVWLAKDKGLI